MIQFESSFFFIIYSHCLPYTFCWFQSPPHNWYPVPNSIGVALITRVTEINEHKMLSFFTIGAAVKGKNLSLPK